MRLPLIPPEQLSPEQIPLAADMRAGIAKSFKGFVSVKEDVTLMGPWNPWMHEPVIGKAILFARCALAFPDDGPWLDTLRQIPGGVCDFADIPPAGQTIAAGRPVLTLFAGGDSLPACRDNLRQMAADLDRRLWKS